MLAFLEPISPRTAPKSLSPYLVFSTPNRRAPTPSPTARRHGGRTASQAGRRVLFLDFDGVLHPGPAPVAIAGEQLYLTTTHFGWLPSLLSLLRQHQDVGVVVHSTWRLNYDEDELREILSELGDRYLGATPVGERYASILQWLKANPDITNYRILDDEADEFPYPLPEQLIVCDPVLGVTGVEVVAALRAWLSS